MYVYQDSHATGMFRLLPMACVMGVVHGVVLSLSLYAAGSPSPGWQPGFHEPALNGAVASFAWYDDGSGPALYAGGFFTEANGQPLQRIARWGGGTWSFPTGGLNGPVHAMVNVDFGDGPVLVAAGNFTDAGGVSVNNIATWDGMQWSPLGTGVDGVVLTMVVQDDGGSQTRLIAGGGFTSAGGGAANRVAQWDGHTWSAIGDGMNAEVRALAFYDDGNGPQLHSGGSFTMADGAEALRVARWDGTSWHALAEGVNNPVFALCVADEGIGAPVLMVGGGFTEAGGAAASRIARWNGSAWSAVGSGTNGIVYALMMTDSSALGGPGLVVGGSFTQAGGVAASHIARWNAAEWMPVTDPGQSAPNGVNGAVHTFGQHPGTGDGEAILVGGSFTFIGEPGFAVEARGVAIANRGYLAPLQHGANHQVWKFAIFDDGSGPMLHAAGRFTRIGGAPIRHIARWDGAFWSQLGGGLDSAPPPSSPGVFGMVVFDDGQGDGPALFVGGSFVEADGLPAQRVARWNGRTWQALPGLADEGVVSELVVYDDGKGDGPALYAGGRLRLGDGSGPDIMVARWDGAQWSSIATSSRGSVSALAVFDDGSGPKLIAGGTFTIAEGGIPRLAQWDGVAWSGLGAGVSGGNPGTIVRALTVRPGPDGPRLYVGGRFELAGGAPASNVAIWDGAAWSAVPGTFGTGIVYELAFVDDEYGKETMYAVGTFAEADGEVVNRIARLTPSGWAPLGTGLTQSTIGIAGMTMLPFDDGFGPSLLVGGAFALAGDVPSLNMAKWRPEPSSTTACPADLNGDGDVTLGDLLQLLSAWGPCRDCPEDLDGSGAVDLSDLLILLAQWGPCPQEPK